MQCTHDVTEKICRGWPSYKVCHHVIVPSLLPADQPKATELPCWRANTKSANSPLGCLLDDNLLACPMLSYYVLLLCLSTWPCALVMVQYLEDVIKHSRRIPACLLSIPPCCRASLCCFCCLLFGFFRFVLCFVSSSFLPPRMSPHISVCFTHHLLLLSHIISLFLWVVMVTAQRLEQHLFCYLTLDTCKPVMLHLLPFPYSSYIRYVMLASGFFFLFIMLKYVLFVLHI